MQSFPCRHCLQLSGHWLTIIGAIFLSIDLIPGEAHALQVHPEPEGLYSHQIAHLFFLLSMGIFIFWLRKRGLVVDSGWRWIQWGCVMFIVWNATAFLGHIFEAKMTEESFIGKGWSRLLLVQTWASPSVYLMAKMDHLSCVPAILFLYLGLKRMRGRKEAP